MAKKPFSDSNVLESLSDIFVFFAEIGDKVGGVDNLDIFGQAHHKATDSCIVAHLGIE